MVRLRLLRLSRGWLDDRGVRKHFEESPGSMKTGCRVMPGGGNPRESATEKRLPWCCRIVCDMRHGNGETVG